MSIATVDPTTDDSWAALVADSDSSVFHSPDWMRVLSRTYGFEPRAIVVEQDGKPVAGMPFCEIHDIRGSRLVSLPFSDACDPLVSNRDDWNDIVSALEDYRHPLKIRLLHNTLPLEDPRFASVSRARWHSLDLGTDVDAVWGGIDASARRAVRKARREGVEARPAHGLEELRAFFDLHLHTRKTKYGMLAQPFAFFENLWNEFVEQDRGMLMVTLLDDSIIGGIFFLEWNGVMVYKFNASNPEFVNHRPNDLALWTAIEHGIAAGFREIDFGLSDWDQEGLVRYKRKYATTEGTITTLQHQATPGASIDDDVGALLSAVTGLLTDDSVPVGITEEAGNDLYRYFA